MNFGFLLIGHFLALCEVSLASQSYKPKECAAACLGIIGSSYHWDGEQCEGLESENLTTCQCGMPAFIETVVSCVDQLVDSEHSNTTNLAAYNSVIAKCNRTDLSIAQLEAFHANGSALPPYTGRKEVDKFGECNATTAFMPTHWESFNAIQAYRMSELTKPRSHQAGAAILAYWGGIMLIRFIVHWTSYFFPRSRMIANTSIFRRVRHFVTIPATFARKHSQPQFVTRHFPLNIPTREQSLVITGFITLHLGMSFGMLPVHRPSYLFKYNDMWLYNREISYRAGKLTMFEIPLMILFAGRNNFLQWLTSWSHDTFVVYHKWIARAVAFSLLVHAAGHTVDKLSSGSYGFLWSVAYWRWGVSGGVFCGVIVFQAMYAFRRLSYEFFHVVHVLLAIAFIVAGYYHLKKQRHPEVRYFYAMWAVWAFDWAMRIGRMIISGPFSKADLQLHDGGVIEYTIHYSKLWTPKPGDYAFIHIAQPSSFWESHPFTLSRGVLPGEENCLKMFTRVKNGFTKRTLNKLIRNGGSMTTNVWIDGPYGPSYKMREFDEALFLSGGIGITAPFSYIQGILSDPKSKTKVIKLFWAIGDDCPLRWFKHQINFMAGSGMVEINIFKGGSRRVDPRIEQDQFEEDAEKANKELEWIEYFSSNSAKMEKEQSRTSTSTILQQPLDTASAVRSAIHNAKGSLAILSCAPDAINDTARLTVAQELCKAQHYVEYFEESFSW